MARVPRGLIPLRHRGFRLLASGQLASNLGDAFYAVALPWYVLADHGGALLLGGVLAAYGIPRTVLLAVGGHASDRLRPWTVMMAADSVRAAAVVALAVVAALGPADPYLLVPIAVVLGAGEGLFLPGSFAIVPSLLPDEDLQAGNALTSGGTQLATFIGPAVGGVIVALVGPSPAFALDAVSFIVSAVTLAGVRTVRRPRAASAPADARTADNGEVDGAVQAAAIDQDRAAEKPTVWRLIRAERVLPLLFAINVAANLGSGGMSEVALPALAHGPLDAGAGGYGGLVAAFGGGALLGTVVAAQARRASRPAIVGSLAFLGEAAFMTAVPYLGSAIGAGAALVALGALNGFGNVVTITAFQRWAPAELMGRLMGLVMLSSMGIFPVSVLLGGLVVHDLGPAAFFPLAAAILAAALAVALSQRRWREFGSTGAVDSRSPKPDGTEHAAPTVNQLALDGTKSALAQRRRKTA